MVSVDFFPTMLDLAGLPLQPKRNIDGQSLLPQLRGDDSGTRTFHTHYPHYHGSAWKPGASIRDGDWKLIEWYEDGKLELFNLKKDIGEKSDLAKKHPDKVKTLAAQLAKWRKETGAKMPKTNKKFDPNKREGR